MGKEVPVLAEVLWRRIRSDCQYHEGCDYLEAVRRMRAGQLKSPETRRLLEEYLANAPLLERH